MPIFEQGQIVRIPFPYTDGATRQHRPALVVSAGVIGKDVLLLWVVMITSAQHRPWVCDVPFGDAYAAAGLPAPSVVRPWKIASIEATRAATLGRAAPELLASVLSKIDAVFG